MHAPHQVQVQPPDISTWEDSASGIAFAHERVGPQPGPEVLVTALVHGNEYSGALALDAFLRTGLLPQCGRITSVFCNTAAFARFDIMQPDASRFIDEDFNRVWADTYLKGPASSAEAKRAREIRPLIDRATHLLDLHSMHEPGAPLLVTGTLPRNVLFAKELASGGQIVVDAGHEDGVRMRDYGPFADAHGERISLLLEAGQHWDRASVSVARNVLMRFLIKSGAVDRSQVPFGWLLPDAPSPALVTVTHRVVARSMSFEFVQDFRGGETIYHAGTPVAHDGGVPVLTPYDNCVLVMPSVRQLRPGVTTVRLGKKTETQGDSH